jgi:plastocyanin
VLLAGACGGDDQARGADKPTPPTVATTVTTTAPGGETSTTAAGMPHGYTIVAKSIAFSPDKLTIPVGQEVEIEFDNQDANVPHNIHFLTPKEIKSDVKNGVDKETLKVKVDKAGKYDFTCDVHPTMKGELTVA